VTLEWQHTPGNLRCPWVTACGQFSVHVSAAGSSGPVFIAGWSPVVGGLYYVGEPRLNVDDAKEDAERHDRKIRETA
jgi:hypothetical protein